MNKLFIPLALGIIMLLSSCVKVLNNDLKKKEPKLVLNAALSPDSTVTVNISQSFNVFENESADNLPFVDSATVQLFENNEYLFDLDNIGAGYYVKNNFLPQVGNKYRVNASYGSFKPIEGITTIPDAVPILEFDTLMLETVDEYMGYNTKYVGILTYQDPEGIANRYQLTCKIFYTGQDGNTYSYDQYINSLESDERFFDNAYGNLLWNDKLTDGKKTTIRFVFYNEYKYENAKNRNSQDFHFVFSFQSINEEYYTYLRTLNIYWESGGSDNPFAEPVVIYSNIENGYGILGGFSQDTTSVDIEIVGYGKKGGNQ